MDFKSLKVILFILAGGLSLPVFAGGLSGVGGGSGVICFPKAELVEQADEYLNHKKLLPEELLAQGELKLLEEWEMEHGVTAEIQSSKPGQTWQQYLADINSNLHDHFPLFFYRLKQTEDLVKFEDWKDIEETKEDYSLLEDAKPEVALPETCRRLQIIIRKSEGNNGVGIGPVTDKPKVQILYVKRYFDRLSVIGKAMLFSHEQVYILGQSVGHTTSDHMRHFVRLFYSQVLNLPTSGRDELLLKRTPFEAKIKYQLVTYLGDYLVYFMESNPVLSGPKYSAQHQFATYLSFMKKKRQEIHECSEKFPEKNGQRNGCMMSVMDKTWTTNDVTNEEAYLFIATFGIENRFGINSDYLMDPSPTRLDLFGKAMKMSCDLIQNEMPESFVLVRKANNYCQEWSAQQPGK